MSMTDDEVQQAAGLLSAERLAALLTIAGTERDALHLHDRMMAVAAALTPVTGIIEIALRNAICEQLRSTFGTHDWLTNPPPPFAWKGPEVENLRRCTGFAQRAAYAKKSQAEKKALDAVAFPNGVPANTSHEARSKTRQKAITVTLGQLIAQLTLFFWKRLFSSDCEEALWRRSLKRLFPNKRMGRADVAAHLEVIYQARNRIAHHEPVYGDRLKEVLRSVDFVLRNFGTPQPADDAILKKMCQESWAALEIAANDLEQAIARFNVTGPQA